MVVVKDSGLEFLGDYERDLDRRMRTSGSLRDVVHRYRLTLLLLLLLPGKGAGSRDGNFGIGTCCLYGRWLPGREKNPSTRGFLKALLMLCSLSVLYCKEPTCGNPEAKIWHRRKDWDDEAFLQ